MNRIHACHFDDLLVCVLDDANMLKPSLFLSFTLSLFHYSFPFYSLLTRLSPSFNSIQLKLNSIHTMPRPAMPRAMLIRQRCDADNNNNRTVPCKDGCIASTGRPQPTGQRSLSASFSFLRKAKGSKP